MKQALCLQHVTFEGPGIFRHLLKHHQVELSCCLTPEEGVPREHPDFLLVMGGPMSVNDTAEWIQPELHFIRQAIARGIPTLGVCLGAQLITKALGGQVAPGPDLEIGPVLISRTPEGQDDPVFKTFPDPVEVFEWHGEGLSLPPTATPLAFSDLYPVQAFRDGTRTYGILFHLELGIKEVEALCRECPKDVQKAGTTPQDLMNSASQLLTQSQDLAERLIAHMIRP